MYNAPPHPLDISDDKRRRVVDREILTLLRYATLRVQL